MWGGGGWWHEREHKRKSRNFRTANVQMNGVRGRSVALTSQLGRGGCVQRYVDRGAVRLAKALES